MPNAQEWATPAGVRPAQTARPSWIRVSLLSCQEHWSKERVVPRSHGMDHLEEPTFQENLYAQEEDRRIHK